MKKTSISVDDELWKEAKKLAIDEGTTIGNLLEKALKEYVKENEKKAKR
jgi:predicted transcriptional regulator